MFRFLFSRIFTLQNCINQSSIPQFQCWWYLCPSSYVCVQYTYTLAWMSHTALSHMHSAGCMPSGEVGWRARKFPLEYICCAGQSAGRIAAWVATLLFLCKLPRIKYGIIMIIYCMYTMLRWGIYPGNLFLCGATETEVLHFFGQCWHKLGEPFVSGPGTCIDLFSLAEVSDIVFCACSITCTTGLQKMFSLSGTIKSNGQNFLSNMCMKHTSQAHSVKSLWAGFRPRAFWRSLVQSAPIFEPFLCKYYYFSFFSFEQFLWGQFFFWDRRSHGPVDFVGLLYKFDSLWNNLTSM